MNDYYRIRFIRYNGGVTPEEAYPSKIGYELDETIRLWVEEKEDRERMAWIGHERKYI